MLVMYWTVFRHREGVGQRGPIPEIAAGPRAACDGIPRIDPPCERVARAARLATCRLPPKRLEKGRRGEGIGIDSRKEEVDIGGFSSCQRRECAVPES